MAKLTSAAKAGRSWWLFMARLKPCPFDSRWALEMGGSHAPSIRGADEESVGSEHPANPHLRSERWGARREDQGLHPDVSVGRCSYWIIDGKNISFIPFGCDLSR